MKILLAAAAVGLASGSAGDGAQPSPIGLAPDDLCFFVADKVSEPPGHPDGRVRFIYQARIFAAAQVVPADGPDITQAKIQRWWAQHQSALYCNVLNSNVRNAHLLRLAVDRSSDPFITDVVRRWRLDLNHVDRGTGGTVLDYVDQEIRRAAGTPRLNSLVYYRGLFERFGGRRARELPQADAPGSR